MKQQHYHYIVRGGIGFPLDMLRYDCAWPRTSADAALMTSMVDFRDSSPEMRKQMRKQMKEEGIHISSDKAPTIERWNSFSYEVVLP